MKADGAKKLMKASGVKGIFDKRFIGEDQPPATTDWKIVWVGQEMKLKTVFGSVVSYWVTTTKDWPMEEIVSVFVCPIILTEHAGNKLLGDASVPSNDNVQIYEISKGPCVDQS